MLAGESMFATTSLEDLLAGGVLPAPTVAAVGQRYLPDWPAPL